MEIEVKQGGIQTAEADTIVVNLFEGGQAPTGATGAVDMALQGALTELIEAGDLTGKAGEVVTVYPRRHFGPAGAGRRVRESGRF